MLRVLILEGSQKPPTFVANLIQGLLERGCHVALFGKSYDGTLPEIKSANFTRIVSRYARFNFVRLLLDFIFIGVVNPLALRKSFTYTTRSGDRKVDTLRTFQLAKLLNFNPDVVHIQWVSNLEEFTGLLHPSLNLKVVVSLRGKQINVTPIVNERVEEVYRKWFPQVSAFHTVSRAISKTAVRYGAYMERTHVIYSGVPEVFFNAFNEEYAFAGTSLKILSIGRFHWQKGYSDALDAVKILKSRGIPFHYTIVAPGIIPDQIVHQIHTDNLMTQVTVVKGIPYQAMIEEMKKHDVLLLPSVIEGIANVVLEAMAVGLPVVSTDCGGMSEVVVPGETGILVPRRNPEAMANGLIAFQKLPELEIKRLRLNAWNLAKTSFSQPQQIEKFIQLYRSLS